MLYIWLSPLTHSYPYCHTPFLVFIPQPMQGYDILEDMYSPKTAVANFAHDLCKHKRIHLDKFMGSLVAVLQQFATASGEWQGPCACPFGLLLLARFSCLHSHLTAVAILSPHCLSPPTARANSLQLQGGLLIRQWCGVRMAPCWPLG